MATYEILYWHNIPLQVRAGGRGDRVSKALSPRFQDAVDRAAMAAGITGTDGYLNMFRWSEPEEQQGSPLEVAESVAADLEQAYETIDWRKTAADLKEG